MNKKEIISKFEAISIRNLSHDGRGIAMLGNKTTFIQGALPNELVKVQNLTKHSQYNEAEVQEIMQRAQERATPPCQHFGICGGCSLQHMEMTAQLDFKQQTLLDQLKYFGKVSPEHVLPPLTVNQLAYRRKARLGVKFVIKKNKILVGFREKKSRFLADLKNCAILFPAVGEKLEELGQLIYSLDAFQHIPQIEVAVGDQNVALVFRHLVSLIENDVQKLKNFGKAANFSIYLQPNKPLPISKIYPEDNFNFLTYSLPEENLTFLFHPLDFTQINLELNRLMVKQALALLELSSHDQVLDLFCGIGNFTLPIAKKVKHVLGVEVSQDMVNRANLNAQHNQIQNVAFYVDNLAAPNNPAWFKKEYNKILLDPPRVGAKEILPQLAKLSAEKICYVSCNSATLARDAGELVHKYGYCLKFAGIMNMFPHTAHFEAMAIFTKT